MRLPHDADGGRDTEKMWYRGMVDVTAIKNSNRMALGSRRGVKRLPTQWRKGHLMHSEFIDIIAVEGEVHGHCEVWERKWGCEHTPRSLDSIIIGETRGAGHLDMHFGTQRFMRAIQPEAPGPWIVPGMSSNRIEGRGQKMPWMTKVTVGWP
jgi:hypothetical protein